MPSVDGAMKIYFLLHRYHGLCFCWSDEGGRSSRPPCDVSLASLAVKEIQIPNSK